MLTDTKIKTLKPKDKRYRIADANGLVLEIKPNSAKYWRYRYRFDGRANMISIGEYPFITLAQARQDRDKYQNNQHSIKCFLIGMSITKNFGSQTTAKIFLSAPQSTYFHILAINQ